jgi:hypothetical protein
MDAVATKTPLSGMYLSTDTDTLVVFTPPATSTVPSRSKVAEAPARTDVMLPAGAHVFDGTAGAEARMSSDDCVTTAINVTSKADRRFMNLPSGEAVL